MRKTCENCKIEFSTADSRRKSCSKSCADARRKVNWKQGTEINSVALSTKPELPPPEELPAPYAKRVHDMWAALVGGSDTPTRIA